MNQDRLRENLESDPSLAGMAHSDLLKAVVPQTRMVTMDRADELWAERRRLLFKPAADYGSKAAYRGDKLTRRVWGEI